MKIPVTSYGYIEYGDSVMILEDSEGGNEVDWQFDGVMCRQASIKGVVLNSFTSKLKYFDPEFWNTATSWGTNFPKRIYFQDGNVKAPSWKNSYSDKKLQEVWNKCHLEADRYSRPVDRILKSILENVSRKTGLTVEFPYEDTTYGVHWYEAFIPIKIGKKRCILTWENCD